MTTLYIKVKRFTLISDESLPNAIAIGIEWVYSVAMSGTGITPAKVATAIWLYKNGQQLAAIQKATTIPLKHLKRIIAKHDLAFGDDSWTRLLEKRDA